MKKIDIDGSGMWSKIRMTWRKKMFELPSDTFELEDHEMLE